MSDENSGLGGGGLGKWWVASGILLVVVLIGLVIVLLFPRHHDDSSSTTPPAPVPTPTAATDPSSTASSGSGWNDRGCNGTTGSSSVPAAPPKGITWEPLGPVSVPTSPTYGPTSTNGPLRQCFQHSPTGALVAAVNILSAANMGPSYNASAVVDHQLTDGAFKKQEQTLATSNDPSDALSAVVSAYDIASCAPTRCNVDLVLSQDGIQARYHVSMVWQSGDWLVDGAVDPGGARVPAPPAGFTNWAPGA